MVEIAAQGSGDTGEPLIIAIKQCRFSTEEPGAADGIPNSEGTEIQE
jgi:hypothetical protein